MLSCSRVSLQLGEHGGARAVGAGDRREHGLGRLSGLQHAGLVRPDAELADEASCRRREVRGGGRQVGHDDVQAVGGPAERAQRVGLVEAVAREERHAISQPLAQRLDQVSAAAAEGVAEHDAVRARALDRGRDGVASRLGADAAHAGHVDAELRCRSLEPVGEQHGAALIVVDQIDAPQPERFREPRERHAGEVAAAAQAHEVAFAGRVVDVGLAAVAVRRRHRERPAAREVRPRRRRPDHCQRPARGPG